MEKYEKVFEVKWADLDPNRRMRHTAYNDYCAHMRIGFLAEIGLPLHRMEELNIGHTIISRAVLVGLERAVREMKDAISGN